MEWNPMPISSSWLFANMTISHFCENVRSGRNGPRSKKVEALFRAFSMEPSNGHLMTHRASLS